MASFRTIFGIDLRSLALVFSRSALFWPLGRAFASRPFRRPGDRLYEFIATNRDGLGELTSRFLPYRSDTVDQGPFAATIVGIFMVLIFYWNLSTLTQISVTFPPQLSPLRDLPRLDQKWNMFAPYPAKSDGWFVIRGVLVNGTVVDVYNHRPGEPSFVKPKYVSKWYGDYRWRKYISRILGRHEKQLVGYARYLCHSWNKEAPLNHKLWTFEIYYNKETTLPDYRGNELRRSRLWRHRCLDKK